MVALQSAVDSDSVDHDAAGTVGALISPVLSVIEALVHLLNVMLIVIDGSASVVTIP